jgi:hypothetical protein
MEPKIGRQRNNNPLVNKQKDIINDIQQLQNFTSGLQQMMHEDSDSTLGHARLQRQLNDIAGYEDLEQRPSDEEEVSVNSQDMHFDKQPKARNDTRLAAQGVDHQGFARLKKIHQRMITDESGKQSQVSAVQDDSQNELRADSSNNAYRNGDQSSDREMSSISPLEIESAINLKMSGRRDATVDISSRRNSKETQIR